MTAEAYAALASHLQVAADSARRGDVDAELVALLAVGMAIKKRLTRIGMVVKASVALMVIPTPKPGGSDHDQEAQSIGNADDGKDDDSKA